METGKAIWKVYARVYDNILLRFHPYRELLIQVRETLSAEDGWRVLDAACGTGNFMHALLDSAVNVSLVGVDFEKAMLERARRKLGPNGQVSLQEANLDLPLPFADAEFDGIVCVNALYTLANPRIFIAECGRVLKTGGKFILVTPPEEPGMGPVFREYVLSLRRLYPRAWKFFLVVQLLRVSPSLLLFLLINRVIQGQSAYTFFSETDLKTLVSRGGFFISKLERTYGGQAWLLGGIKLPAAAGSTTGEGA